MLNEPKLNEEDQRIYDDIYKKLYAVYTKNTTQYIKEATEAKKIIVERKPLMPTSLKPYPVLHDPKFNERLLMKKEFQRLRSEKEYGTTTSADDLAKGKCSVVDFKLTSNQKFVKNFMSPLTPYNGILLFHSVGVGKTCPAISIAEQYLHESISSKKVLVVLPSNLEENFKRQIFDISRYDILTNTSTLCTGTKYPDMILDKDSITHETLEKRIERLIRERYEFVGYKELVHVTSKIMEKLTKAEKNEEKRKEKYEAKIRSLFSNRLIIIDEAHNLRMSSDQGKKQIANTMQSILQIAENTKLVLMTATPMFDNAKEIVWLMNLLLTNDKRPTIKTADVFNDHGAVTEKGKAILMKACRGYVSFMRGENPFSFPLRLYPDVNRDKNVLSKYPTKDNNGKTLASKVRHLTLIETMMSDRQRTVYEAIKTSVDLRDDEEDVDDAPSKGATALQTALHAGNIVYPSSSTNISHVIGEEGFQRCFTITSKKPTYKTFAYTDWCLKEHGEILAYDAIGTWSPKLKRILDYIINSEGIVFVYSQFYYSAIFPLMIALEHIGFQKYGGKNVTSGTSVSNKFQGRRPSYMVVSADKGVSGNMQSELAAVTAPSNKHGDDIKVIIASKVGSEGINFKRIREIHVVEPWYNLNRIEQVIGRGVRTCSHVDLPASQRNVTVFLHALTYTDTEESIDLKTYRVAETKQQNIMDVQRLLKETAIDCALNMDAVTFPKDALKLNVDIRTSQGVEVPRYAVGDMDGTYVCDFRECAYKCTPDISLHSQETSTFHPLFIVDDIDLYKRYIARAFWNVRDNTFNEIKRVVSEYVKVLEIDVLSYALQEMLDTKFKFVNSRGSKGFLLYRGDRYIFQDAMLHETKLTLEEREDTAHRGTLDMQQLFHPTKKAKQQKKASPVKDVDVTPTKPVNVVSIEQEEKIAPPPPVHKTQLPALEKKSENILTYVKVSQDVLLDFITDRLPFDDLVKVVLSPTTPFQSTLQQHIFSKTPLVYREESKKPLYVYNMYEKSYYAIGNGQPKKVGPLEKNRNAKIFQYMEESMRMFNNVDNKTIKGFMDIAKDFSVNFKIRDKNTKGYVCHKTSSLLLDDLRTRVKDIDTSANVDGPIMKVTLCEVYELVIRSKMPTMFKRPFP